MSEQNADLSQPTKDDVARHLRSMHGYDIAYSVSAHPSTLLREHERIHVNGLAHDHQHGEVDQGGVVVTSPDGFGLSMNPGPVPRPIHLHGEQNDGSSP